jgi:hypothetical protein
MKGWLHWRLLGALIKGDARAAYSRSVVAPSSSLRPLSSARAAPAPLCSAQALDLIQSIIHSSALSLRTGPPRPLVHLATVSPCSEKKMGLEVRDMRRCPFVLAPPHSAAGPRGPTANARGYAKADSCPPPAAVDCAARCWRGNAVLPLAV